VVALGIVVAAALFEFDAASDNLANALSRSLILLALVMILYRLVDVMAVNSNNLLHLTGMSIEERLLPFIRTAAKVMVVMLGLVIVLQEWNIEVTGLIASLGVIGLAFSLAAKDTVENLFGFTAIVSDNPFQVGDFVVHPDVTGSIEQVGMRSTRVRQLDQGLVTVPNSKMAQAAILNWSRLAKRRYRHTIGVTYSATSADIRELLRQIEAMLLEREHIDPESVLVRFWSFGDSALEILVQAYILLEDFAEAATEQQEIHLAIMDIVEELGMSMAFPSRSVYIENLPGVDGEGRPDLLTARARSQSERHDQADNGD